MSRTLVLLALTLLGPVSAGAQPLPAGPISAFDGRVVVGGEIAATFGAPRTTAPTSTTPTTSTTRCGCCGCRWPRPGGRSSRLALRRRAALRGPRHDPLPTPPTSASGPGQPRPRHPGRPDPAVVRRLRPARLPELGQPAHRLSARLSVPHLAAAGRRARRRPPTCWRCGRAAGASSYPVGSQTPGPGVPLVTAFRWDTGVQAHWAGRHGRRHRRRSRPARSPIRRAVDNNDGSRSPDGSALESGAGSHRRRLRRARRVPDEAIARTLPGPALGPLRADGVRRRRRVLARPLAGPRRAGLEPLERAARRRAAVVDLAALGGGSRAATASIPAYLVGAARSPRVLASPGRTIDDDRRGTRR